MLDRILVGVAVFFGCIALLCLLVAGVSLVMIGVTAL